LTQWGWFGGPVENGGFNMATESGIVVSGKLSENGATGSVRLVDGRALSFNAGPATGAAGLYRAEATINGVRHVGGWIVLPDGEQRGGVIGGTTPLPGGTLSNVSGPGTTTQVTIAGVGSLTAGFVDKGQFTLPPTQTPVAPGQSQPTRTPVAPGQSQPTRTP
jgi:hypothetical protein